MKTMDGTLLRMLPRSAAALWLLVAGCLGPSPDEASMEAVTRPPAESGPLPMNDAHWSVPPGGVLQAGRFGGMDTDEATGVASDGCEGFVVAGYFKGTTQIGGFTLESAGDFDAYVAHVRKDGHVLWARRFGGPLDDRAQGVAVDADGDVLLAGFFHDTVDFGTGPLVSQGGADGFLAAYGPDGTPLWSRRLGGSGDDRALGVAARQEVVAVTGSFQGSASFGGAPAVSQGADDVFVASFKNDGSYGWSSGCGGIGPDAGWGVAVDDRGDVAVTGSQAATGTATCTGTRVFSMQQGFVTVFGPDGALAWSRSFSESPQGLGSAVAYDSLGNVALTGYFRGTVNVGGGPLTSAGDFDGLVAKYSPAGAFLWAKILGGPNYDILSAITVDAQDRIVVAGTSQTGTLFTSRIASYSPTGRLRWRQALFGTGDVRAWGVAAGQSLAVAGDFKNSIELGGTLLDSAGDTDAFLAQLSP